jgi:hypothetical protein
MDITTHLQTQRLYRFDYNVAFFDEPVVKLPCGVSAGGAASLTNQLVGFWLVFECVKCYLHGAFDVVAEFPLLISRVTL